MHYTHGNDVVGCQTAAAKWLCDGRNIDKHSHQRLREDVHKHLRLQFNLSEYGVILSSACGTHGVLNLPYYTVMYYIPAEADRS